MAGSVVDATKEAFDELGLIKGGLPVDYLDAPVADDASVFLASLLELSFGFENIFDSVALEIYETAVFDTVLLVSS